MNGRPTVRWPDGARFAFTIFDDTDMSTLANAPAVYRLLTELGMPITKSVWMRDPDGPGLTGGSSCADPRYLSWVRRLQADGHEIGYHNAADEPTARTETVAALDRFRAELGHDPRIGADHAGNTEAVYAGADRLSGVRAGVYGRALRWARPDATTSEGHLPHSDYFWGDVLHERIDYWRSFTFPGLDAFAACPDLPYHDPDRPYVRWWYPSTHAPTLEPFLDALAPERLDALEAVGGLAIIYTHFGTDFCRDGRLDPRFVAAMRDLARRPVWCAPTSTVLDHVRSQRDGDGLLDARARSRLENRWIAAQLRIRARSELAKALRQRRRGSRPA